MRVLLPRQKLGAGGGGAGQVWRGEEAVFGVRPQQRDPNCLLVPANRPLSDPDRLGEVTHSRLGIQFWAWGCL